MSEQNQWKSKFQEIFSSCQEELKKTTEIGKKMLNASKTNSNLHENYEELGSIVLEALRSGDLKWENERVKQLILEIENCEQDLEVIEKEVNDIRFSEETSEKTTQAKDS